MDLIDNIKKVMLLNIQLFAEGVTKESGSEEDNKEENNDNDGEDKEKSKPEKNILMMTKQIA